jgi:hypothetical protein
MSYGYNPSIGGPPPIFPDWNMGGMNGAAGSDMASSMMGWGGPQTGAPNATGVPAGANLMGSPKLGLNMGTANLALSGLSTIGNLWAAFQAQKLARQQFDYTKNVTDTNLANQIKTYNTTLTDRANNRSKVEGHDAGWAQGYIDTNALKRA